MGAIATLLQTYTFLQVIILLLVVFVLYIIYKKVIDDDYYSDLQDIKTKFQARMWEYVSGELRVIEATSLNKAEEILGMHTTVLAVETPEQMQFAMFSLVLERTLHHNIFESIKTAIRINGFHSMNPEELQIYITDKSDVLLRESRKSINARRMYYPKLSGTEEVRFSVSDSTKFYGKIVHKSIKLQAQEKAEIKKLKHKYSIIAKLNLIKIIMDKFSKEVK
jgi:hypothetical protein